MATQRIIIEVDGNSYKELTEQSGINAELVAGFLKNDAEYGIDKTDFSAFAERILRGEDAELIINPLRRGKERP